MPDTHAYTAEQLASQPVTARVEDPAIFPIVGLVGASGSRQALETFFRHLPNDSGMAFVVVTRLAAKQHSQLAAAIEARTDMPVLSAADGVAVQLDHIYIAPLGVQLTIAKGILRLHNHSRAAEQGLLDTFLSALAVDQQENAVAVLLSGTGEDGIAGIQAVKTQGGIVLVQDPDNAAHPALPRRGVATGITDHVNAAAEIAQYLIQIRGDLANAPLPTQQAIDESFTQIFTAVLGQIVTQTGHDLSHYKASTLQRRIARRMQMAGIHDLARYLALLQTNPEETRSLFRDSLVSVTNFFRDPDAYEMLERDCIPQLFLNKGRTDFVRIWVAGCATGEEAYSIAIQLAERVLQMQEPPRFQIFATDLNEEAIAVARRGLYPTTIAKDIAPARLQRYFVEENGAYRINPELREHVLFAVHNLLKDPPFSRVDLICCRNVLIYFTREAQERIFNLFHYSLNAGGYLFLGTSESADTASDLFAVLNKYCHLYQRRDVISVPQHRLPTATPVTFGAKSSERTTQPQNPKARTVEEMYTAWTLRMHTPPRLLVNEHYDITYLFGGADRYLQEREGAITQNVLHKVLPDLRLDLRAALYQAFNKREHTISRLMRVELEGRSQMVQLHVGPVTEPGFPHEYVEVLFVVQENAALLGLPPTDEAVEIDLSLVARMEEELLRTRERLQTIIEEYEVSGQELKASNEELQSINEELKSTTEELETSKEELQSMNEELITVNHELKFKIDELSRVNSDLLNLIASTDVGVIFLDQRLCVKRFTPRATELFHLIESDLGRPFAHIAHRIRTSTLAVRPLEYAARVLETLEQVETIIQSEDERWYMLRFFPYRTIDQVVDGVVITFIDISDLKRAESEVQQRIQQQAVAELGRQALRSDDLPELLNSATARIAQTLELDLCAVFALHRADGEETLQPVTGVGWPEAFLSQTVIEANNDYPNWVALQQDEAVVVEDIAQEKRLRFSLPFHSQGAVAGISVVIGGSEQPYGVLAAYSKRPYAFAVHEVSFVQSVANLLGEALARQETEAQLRASEERYRTLANAMPQLVWTANAQGNVDYYNVRIDDYDPAVRLVEGGFDWQHLVHPDDLAATFAAWQVVTARGDPYTFEHRLRMADHSWRWHLSLAMPMLIGDDQVKWYGTATDIHERKQIEEALRASEAQLNAILYNMPASIYLLTTDHHYLLVNRIYEQENNITNAEIRGQSVYDRWPSGVADALAANEQQALAAKAPITIEESVPRNGKTHYYSTVKAPLLNEAGEPYAIIGISTDITARKRVEEALRQSEERYRMLFETMDEGFCILEMIFDEANHPLDYRFVEINPAFEKFTGLEQAVGKTARELVPNLESHWFEIYGKIALTGDPQRFVEGSAAMGRWFDVYAFRLGGPESRRVALLFSNITERKRAEDEVKRSRNLLQRMAEASPDDISIYDLRQQQMIYSNRRSGMSDFSGQTTWSTTPAEIDSHIHPDDVERVQKEFARIHTAADSEVVEIVFRWQQPDGDYCWRQERTVVFARDEQERVTQHLSISTDITERKYVELNQQFLLDLDERTRLLDDAEAILVTTAERLGQYLDVAHCTFNEIDPDADQGIALTHWRRSDELPNLTGVHKLSAAMGLEMTATLVSGRSVVVSDALHDPRTAGLAARYAAIGVQSIVRVPFKLKGALVGLLAVADDRPRLWRNDEVTLLENVIAHIWPLVVKARAEKELRASEARFRTLANTVPSIIWTAAPDGTITYANDRWFHYCGLTPEENTRQWPQLMLHPDDFERCVTQWSDALEAGEEYEIEVRNRRYDGVYRWFITRATPLHDAEGRITAWFGVTTDIDDRKRAERNQQFLSELSAELSLFSDPAQIQQTVVQRLGEHLGASRCRFSAIDLVADKTTLLASWRQAGEQPPLHVIPLSAYASPAYIADAQAGRTVVVSDASTDGSPVTPHQLLLDRGLSAQVSVPCLRNGQWVASLHVLQSTPRQWRTDEVQLVESVVHHFWPLMEKTRAETALRRQEELVRQITDNVPGLIGYVGADERYHFVNATFETWFQRPRHQIIGGTVRELIGDEERVRLGTYRQQVLAGEIVSYETDVAYPDGVTRAIWGRYQPQFAADGAVLGFYLFVMDISERKQAEADLRFLAELAERIRLAEDAKVLLAEATNQVGAYLGVGRAFFAEQNIAQDQGVIHHQYSPTLPPVATEFRLSSYPSATMDELAAGHTVVNHDAQHDPRTAAIYATVYAPEQESAYIGVPLLQQGQLVTTLSVTTPEPRQWQAREIRLLETVAERVWLAVEKLRLDAELRHSNVILSGVLESSNDAIFVRDRAGHYLLVNAAGTEQVGMNKEVLIGKPYRELFAPDAVAIMRSEDRPVLEQGLTITLEHMSEHNGITRYWHTLKMPLRNTVGEIIGLISSARDITERKRAEELLRASEERLRLGIDLAGLVIAEVDYTDDTVHFTPEAAAIYGLPSDTLILPRGNFHALFHPDEYADVIHRIEEALDPVGDGWLALEHRIVRPDGLVRWLNMRQRTFFRVEGEQSLPQRALLVARDITERKENEVALRASEARYRQLADAMPQIVWRNDRTGQVEYLNQQWLDYTGLTWEESLQDPNQAIHPHDSAVAVAAWQASVPIVSSYQFKMRLRRYDGVYRWFLSRCVPVYNDEGAIINWYGASTDIDDLKQAEEALRISELRFRSTFENAAVGIAEIGLDGRWLRVNERLTEIVGYTSAELQATTFQAITYPDDLEADLANMQRVLAGEAERHHLEKRYFHKEGHLIWIYLSVALLRDQAGAPQYFIAVVEDINERKQQEQALQELNATLDQRVRDRTAELERSNRELDRFAYVASHDLKSPLRGIDTLATWISEDADAVLPAASKEHLSKLHGRIKRLENLLDDLLAYSRAGRYQYSPESVATGPLVQDIIELLDPPSTFKVTVAEAMPKLLATRTPLETVLRNLINNAIKHHNRADGHIHIVATEYTDHIEFTVSDDGPGIDPQYHDRIFELFQTLKPRDQVEGSGMGLAIVKKTVENYGGWIRVESAEGQGTTFRFTWPKWKEE